MEMRLFEASGNILVRLKGRIVLDECDRLKSAIGSSMNPQTSQVNIDLSEVDFIDSAGLGALVGIKISANKHRARLTLINPSRGVSDILMVSKLDSIFEIITGTDADQLIQEVAKPANERQAPGAAEPAASSGPAMPSMPERNPAGGAQAPEEETIKDRVDRLCKEAVEFMRRGDYESAADCYQKAVDLNPEYLPAHNNLAIVFEKRPHWHEKAIEQWRKVLALSENNNDQKHIDRAKKHIENLERLGPSSPSS